MPDTPDPTEPAAPAAQPNTEDAPLGDKGEKALEAWKTRAREAEKEAKRAKDLETELQQFRDRDKTEQERAIEKARKEAGDAAGQAATAKANARILRAEIKAAAGGKLADPADAVRLLDLDDFEVNDDGDVDDKAIAAAIDALLADKPYLAAKGGRPRGDVDQGVRTNGGPIDPRAADLAQIEADLKVGARRR